MTDGEIIDAILRHEGGYVNDPVDRGRCTNHGITLATLSSWRGHAVTCEDVKALTESEARQIYKERYLQPFDAIEAAIKPHVVDIAVNSGVFRARQLLSMAQQSDKPIAVALVIERLKFYARIVAADPQQARFFNGWINRAVSFL